MRPRHLLDDRIFYSETGCYGGSTTATSDGGFFVIELSLARGELTRRSVGRDPVLINAGFVSKGYAIACFASAGSL